MATVSEALGTQSPIAAALRTGTLTISANQTIRFTKYVRLILPLDGYAFWVRADMVSQGALYNAMALNRVAFNQPIAIEESATVEDAQGSLHFSTDLKQEETQTQSTNRMVFTSVQEVKNLNEIGPLVMFIAEVAGVRFAFSSRGSFYDQAKLWHYVGTAVQSDMDPQIVDSPVGFSRALVVSNSLPLWLALNNYVPFYGFGNPSIPLYPSFLVPANLPPPYAAVHIDPGGTQALASAPRLGATSSHSQLTQDRVRVTLFGVRNDAALDFLDCVLQRSADYGEFGLMNMPVVRDDKRPQVEIAALGQKKIIDFDISYHQTRMNDIARQIITSAVPSYFIQDSAVG